MENSVKRLGLYSCSPEVLLDSGLPWPQAYSNLLPLVRQKLGVEGTICLSRELRGGKSGAQVLVADVHSPDYTGQAILKLDKAWNPDHGGQPEPKLLMQAIDDAPEFAKDHLPRLLFSVHQDNQFAILSTIAGRGLEYADPWPEVGFEQQLLVTKQFSRELCEKWNKDYKLSSGIHRPQDLLRSWLGHRLDAGSGGRIHDFLANQCKLDVDTPSITFEGHWFPNPLAFAEGVIDLPDRLQIRAVTGHCHGDLHGMNLLVGLKNPRQPDYFLIDLADYNRSQFLFFDHAYFEISHLLVARENRSASYWEALFNALSRRSKNDTGRSLQADDLGLMEIVGGLRGEVESWIDQNEHDRLSYMESQYLLAKVAAGLNFAHKKMDSRLRRVAFLYAASNLKDYLELNRLEWPKHGPSFSIDADAAEPMGKRASAATASGSWQEAAPATQAADVETPRDTSATNPSEEQPKKISFFAELRRRNVIKVAAGYIVVAWLCLQVAIVLQTSLRLPDWTDSLVATLLVLGFPIACIFAWAYELSPTGLQRTSAVMGPEDRPSRFGVAVDSLLGISVLLILAIAVVDPVYNRLMPGTASISTTTEQTSIAVLPFRNLSGLSEDDGFSDGLTIEIMSALARTGEFRVPGQRSSFRFKDKNEDLREIGITLGVQYLLEGSVRRNEDDFRIEAQLVQADDGFLIWSDVYDETLQDLFSVQEKIASEVGRSLKIPLQISADSLEDGRTENEAAYELFVKALGLYEQRGAGIEEAARLLAESVRIDPEFAAGWAARSLVYNVYPSYVDSDNGNPVIPAARYSRSHEFALRANSLNPDLPIVQYAMANMFRRNRQWFQAEDMYRSALDQRPGAHEIMEDYAELLTLLGRHEQAIAMGEEITGLDPFNSLYEYRLLEAQWAAEPSAANAERVIEFFAKDTPQQEQAGRIAIGYLTQTGQTERLTSLIENCGTCDAGWRSRVLQMLESVGEESPQSIYETYRNDGFVGYMFLDAIGGPDLVLDAYLYFALTTVPETSFFGAPWSVMNEVGTTKRFKFLIEQTGILNYWRERGWPEQCKPIGEDDFECT